MKPLKLVLHNAGPFKEEEINFNDLDNMFLICGNTGAGKTSIFDAMTFALYGKLNGQRSEHDLFSTYARQEENGFVIFKFELFGEKYQITRTIQKEYVNRNGKISVSPSELEFGQFDSDGNYKNFLGKKNELDKKIVDLIGFTFEEFSKIVVLPQGQFAEFLHQGSKQRGEILERLFNVSDYKLIIEDAKNLFQEKQQGINALELSLENLLKEFNPQGAQKELQEFNKALEEIQTELKAKEKSKEDGIKEKTKLEAEYSFAVKNEENKKELFALKQGEKIIAEKTKKIALAEEASSFAELLHNQENAESALCNLEQKKKACKEELSENEKNLEGLFAEKEKIQGLEKQREKDLVELEKLKNLKETAIKIFEAKSALENFSKEFQAQEKSVSGIEKEIWEMQAQFHSLSKNENEIESELEEKKLQAQNAKDALHSLYEILSKAGEKESLEDAGKKDLEELKAAQEKADAAKKLSEKTEAALLELKSLSQENEIQNASVVLLKNLKPGQPCPLCGSTTHPKPFVLKEKNFDFDQEIKDQENQLEINRAQEQSCKELLVRFSTKIEQTKETLKKFPKDLPTKNKAEEDYNNAKNNLDSLNDLVEKLSSIKKQIDVKNSTLTKEKEILSNRKLDFSKAQTELETLVKNNKISETEELSKEKIQVALEKLEQKILDNKNTVDSFKEKFDAASKDNASIKSRLKEIEENFFAQEKLLENAKDSLNAALCESAFKNIQECKNAFMEKPELLSLKKEVDDWNNNVTKLQALISDQKETEESKLIQKKIEEKEATLKTTEEQIEELKGRAGEISFAKINLEKQEKNFIQTSGQLERLQKEIAPYKMLYNDLSLKNPKNISFETWVLAYYFGEVVSYANKRFYEISQGRYEFKISGKVSGNGYKGLDLLVTDSYTGKDRDTSTLSGGETFMASISLALALTDVVQSKNGGIQLDSIFIDEGFGTLDDETLNCAMSVFNDLQETKMVGIISHVETLQTQIASHIEVEKTRLGSHIKIV